MTGKIALFGGTAEGRLLARELAECRPVTAFVATGAGAELLDREALPGLSVLAGRLDRAGMEEALRRGAFAAAVDATHPYAREASENLRAAAAAAGVPYFRLRREETPLPPGCLTAGTPEEAAALCRELPGNILLAAGAKELPAFCREPGLPERLYPRVLPTAESIAACREAGVPFSRIIAMTGPFSLALNLALMEQFSIGVLVTKDGGKAGGTEEKLEAARRLGVRTVVIRRPPEPGESWPLEKQLERLLDERGEEGTL